MRRHAFLESPSCTSEVDSNKSLKLDDLSLLPLGTLRDVATGKPLRDDTFIVLVGIDSENVEQERFEDLLDMYESSTSEAGENKTSKI